MPPSPVNIAEPTKITAWLAEMADGDAATARLLGITLLPSLKRRKESAVDMTALPENAPDWLKAKWETCGPFHAFAPDAALTDKVRHIKDWLVSAQRHGAEFLTDLDEEGRPKKLVQLDLGGAHNAADKYFAQLRQKFREVAEDDADTQTIMRFDGGHRLVRLLTPNALKVEGNAMGHCIGGGAYDAALLSGQHEFYSLRDPSNKPHATFEIRVEDNALLQCKGKRDEPPVEKYMPMVRAFVTERKFQLLEAASCTGLVRDMDGVYHSIHALPAKLRLDGHLNLQGAGFTTLPEDLELTGNLTVSYTRVTVLPRRLKTGGNLDLRHTEVTELPAELEVGGALLAQDTPLAALPEDMKVGGSILLNDTKVKALPENLTEVGGNLNLARTRVRALPKNLRRIKGTLNLSSSRILSLPENLEIAGDLLLQHTYIARLPPGLKVRDSLYLDNTGISALPEGLRVGKNLNLYGTPITRLPDNLVVMNNLTLPPGLAAPPKGLKVGGNLYLPDVAAVPLPEGLEIGGDLILEHKGDSVLPRGMKIGGTIPDLYMTRIKKLPEDLEIGSLSLTGSRITALPKGLKIKGNFDLTGSKITALPEGLEIGGNLVLGCDSITALPRGLKVGGDLFMYGTDISALPPDLEVGGLIITKFGNFESAEAFTRFIRDTPPAPRAAAGGQHRR